MVNEHHKYSIIKLLDIYLLVTTVVFLAYFLMNMMLKNDVFNYIAIGNPTHTDFYMHYNASLDLKNVYNVSNAICFPPLMYCFYHILTFLKDGNIAFLVYNIIFCVLFLITLAIIFGKKGILLSILLYFSWPIFFTAIRAGNSIVYSMTLIILALELKDRENKVLKELALIFIAIAAAIKLSPCIFGLIYLKEKRYKEAIRLILYGIIFVFVPFIFTGGVDGLNTLISTLKTFSVEKNAPMAIGSYVYVVTKNIIFSDVIRYIFLTASLFLFCRTKLKWKEVFFLGIIACSFLPRSFAYNICYILPSFILYLKNNKFDINFMFFTAIFTIPIYLYFLPRQILVSIYVFWFILTPLYFINVVRIVKNNE